eukprot:jgi/Chrzof1/3801/Cz13g09100.t1
MSVATAAARRHIVQHDKLMPNGQEHQAVEHFFDLGPREVHPWQRPAVPSPEALAKSPHYPVVVTANPMVKDQVFDGSSIPSQQLQINGKCMQFESELFTGKIEVHLKGLPTSQRHLFEGKKRFFHIAVQGKYKRPIAADALCMGQEFVKAGNVPPWIGEVVLTAAARAFSKSTQVDVYARLPYFMNPVLAACQLVNVSAEGEQPDMWAATEDMRLFSAELADKNGAPLSADKRRQWCDIPKNLAGRLLDTEYIWTFHIWQHLIDFSTYKLSVGGFVNLDLTHALNCQPLQLTCKDTKANEYCFSMLVWHDKLLYDDDDSAPLTLAERLTKFKTGIRGLLSRTKAT